MSKMTTEERIKRCFERHPDWSDSRVAGSITCPVADVRAVRMGLSLPKTTQVKTNLVSLDRVIKKYDIKLGILRELSALPEGQLILEADLCQRAAGTDRNRFRRTVENNSDEFRGLRIKLKLDDSGEGKWYWGHQEDIAEAHRIKEL